MQGRNNKKSVKGDFSKFVRKPKSKTEVIFEKTEKSFPKKIKKILIDEQTKIDKKVISEKSLKNVKKETQETTPQKPVEVNHLKLNKYLAHAGLFSRRSAAEIVKEGKVTVNEKVEKNPAYTVLPDDVVKFEGKIVKPEEKKVYILMNKPKNTITTLSDEKGRKTVTEIVQPKYSQRIYPVGRLDRNTTGLLLLTNDGDLTTKLSHPSHKVKKIYHAILDKIISQAELDKIKKGIELEDGVAEVDEIVHSGDAKNEVLITIHIGKNRIVRRIFESLGYVVEKLDRIYYAGLTKKDLPRGFFRDLSKEEINLLKHFTVRK